MLRQAGFGVALLGHSHPAVVAAVTEQARRLVHGMGDVHPPAVKVTNPDTLTTRPFEMTRMGWYLLENKQFDLARRFLQRGLAVSSNLNYDLPAIGNLAHCYLFTGQYDLAINQYKDFLKAAHEQNQYTDMIGQDFIIFKNKGFDKHLMDRVVADLNLEVPKAYHE